MRTEFDVTALNPLPCHCDPDSEAYRGRNDTLLGMFVLLFLNRFCLAVFNTHL
jgi:hypothetical protein